MLSGYLALTAEAVALLETMAPFLGLGLAATGICYLGLWSIQLIQPTPRWGAALLLVSAAGAGRAVFDAGPPTLAWWRWLPYIAVPLLVFAAVFELLGQDSQ